MNLIKIFFLVSPYLFATQSFSMTPVDPLTALTGETFSGNKGQSEREELAVHFLSQGKCIARRNGKLPNSENCRWDLDATSLLLTLGLDGETSTWRLEDGGELLRNTLDETVFLYSRFLKESVSPINGYVLDEAIIATPDCSKPLPSCENEKPSFFGNTCSANDRFETFSSRFQLNKCLVHRPLFQQICDSGLEAKDFVYNCHKLRGTPDTETLPPPGTHISSIAFLPDCNNTIYACSSVAKTRDVGCIATDGTSKFSSMQGMNNNCDGLRVRKQICDAGLKPANFKSACYELDEKP